LNYIITGFALRAELAPHIRECAGKTNAFAGCTAMQPATVIGLAEACRRPF
jgi:hypothetical protein